MLIEYLPILLDGLLTTLSVSLVSLAIASLFGLAGALAKLSSGRGARAVAGTYTTLIRSIPDLVLMLALFYGGQALVNDIGLRLGWDYIDVDPFLAGSLTLGFIYGAYLTETFRGAFLSIPKGQAEAGLAYGMSGVQVLCHITLPQMIRHAIPGFANNWLVMVKASALVSIIGLDDMVHRASLATAATAQPFTFYAAVAAIYLVVTTVSILALGQVEKRFSLGVRKAVL
ncbi:ABC transporter [Niveispirillum lacus]|uniref:ABC transporter n=2 Tax=Niveispirillum lacus TaxID=1981099 RepID=A0A255YR38_9PROT|nr:ABC transporter [Niveispirillum lacus]